MLIFSWITLIIAVGLIFTSLFVIIKQAIDGYWETIDVISIFVGITLLIGFTHLIITLTPFTLTVT